MLEKCQKMPCFGFQHRLRVGRVKCLFAGRNLAKIIKKCPLSIRNRAEFNKNHQKMPTLVCSIREKVLRKLLIDCVFLLTSPCKPNIRVCLPLYSNRLNLIWILCIFFLRKTCIYAKKVVTLCPNCERWLQAQNNTP